MKAIFHRLMNFLREVRHEMNYVSWPNKDDIKEGTMVVIVMSAITAAFLAVVDWVFFILTKFLLFKG
jgi:preprotein translocase subunit SecE